MSITIYGASDDLIEIEGDISEEFELRSDDVGDLIGLSNGCVFRVRYDGCWRITPVILSKGVEWSKIEAVDEDADNYSDRVTVEGLTTWVMHGIAFSS